MIGDDPQLDGFVSAHRWAVLTTLRRDGTPSSSVVAYARDGDELVISTPGGTLKHRTIASNPSVSLCVISNAEPFNFVTIEADARIETENLVAPTQLVFANIADAGWSEPEDLEGWLISQQRVILRLVPHRVSGVLR